MAVEAARDALTGRDRGTRRRAALRLDHLSVRGPAEFGHRRRRPEPVRGHLGHRRRRHPAGRHLGADRGARQRRETLVVASEKRGARAASPVEMTSGDGAAAILVGEGKPIATLLAKASRTIDFVDHFRSLDNQFDYQWEERWIRDAGYMTDRAAGDQALPGAGQGRGQGRHALLHAGDAGARGQLGRQGRRHRRQGGARHPARQLRRHRRRAHAAAAGRRAREGQGRRQDPGGRLRPGCRCAAVRGDARDRQARQEPGRRRPSGAAQGRDQLRPLPRLQRPDRARARHARRDRQADGAVLAVAQPRDGDGLHRRQVLQVRHAAVSEKPTSASIRTATHSTPRSRYPFAEHGRPHQVLHGRPAHLFARSAARATA